MTAIYRTAGTAGIVVAVLFLVLLSSFYFSDPAAYNDPAKALAFAKQAPGLRTLVGIVGVLSGIVAMIFFSGLGHRLGDSASVRGLLTRMFGVVAGAWLTLGSLIDWAGISFLASFKDQVAAQHAWVALFAINAGIYGLTGAFIGIAVLTAGSAMVRERLVSPTAGWLVLASAVLLIVGTVLQAVLPPDTSWLFAFYAVPGVLLIIWFAWTGMLLRRA